MHVLPYSDRYPDSHIDSRRQQNSSNAREFILTPVI
jgi:hypothetical protein